MFRAVLIATLFFVGPCCAQNAQRSLPQLVLVHTISSKQVTIEFTVYKPVYETRTRTINKNGERVEIKETVVRQVPEVRRRVVPLVTLVVKTIDGKPRTTADLLAAAKKKKPLPLIYLNTPGQISKRDRLFFRPDLLLVYPKPPAKPVKS